MRKRTPDTGRIASGRRQTDTRTTVAPRKKSLHKRRNYSDFDNTRGECLFTTWSTLPMVTMANASRCQQLYSLRHGRPLTLISINTRPTAVITISREINISRRKLKLKNAIDSCSLRLRQRSLRRCNVNPNTVNINAYNRLSFCHL